VSFQAKLARKWLQDTVTQLVDSPAQVSVTCQPTGKRVSFVVTVDPGDVGQVVGKHGRTAQSLRHILMALGRMFGHTFELDIQ
jgi:hypothetical protein